MKISVFIPPCLRCLSTSCVKCPGLSKERCNELAEGAWRMLHDSFPGLVPPYSEGETKLEPPEGEES